jgi:hypothetical protein
VSNSAHRNRIDAEFSEYGIGTAISTMNPLVDEALDLAFTKGASLSVKRTTGSIHPSEIKCDKNADGLADSKLNIDYRFPARIDKISLDSNNDGKPDGTCKVTRSFGRLDKVEVDYDNDGKIDLTAKVNRLLLDVDNIEIDTNGDGKPDVKMTPDLPLFGNLRGIKVDVGADGKQDGYIEYKRNNWGNIDRLKLRR